MNDATETDTLRRLQGLRLKGRSDAARIAGSWGDDESSVTRALESLVAQGLVEEKKGTFALTESGESRRVQLLEAERSGLDDSAMQALYGDFCEVDPRFKSLVADLQLGKLERDEAAAHLAPLHLRLQPLLDRASALLPRLSPYAQRFQEALQALQQGDPRYLASPLVESYHGIWFEFHEELIQSSGRSRAQEA